MLSLDALLLRGGYPELHTSSVPSHDWMASYVATYLERDVRQLLKVQDLSAFSCFLRLCAGRTGQLLIEADLMFETAAGGRLRTQWGAGDGVTGATVQRVTALGSPSEGSAA